MNLAEIALRKGAVEASAGLPAFLTADGPISNAQLQQLVSSYVVTVQSLGFSPGDKVLLRLTNSVQFASAFLAVVWLGGVPVLQNSQFGRNELEYIVDLTQPRGIILGTKPDTGIEGLASTAWRATATSGALVASGKAVVPASIDRRPPAYDARPEEPAMVVFTSGTTGRPKGIVHAHRWLDALGDSNRARIPPRADDVALATGEWSFISALGHNVLFPLRNGVAGSIMDDRANPERILATVARDRVTVLYSVATLYRRILSQPDIEHRFDLSSLRGVNATGEPLEEAVRDEWERRFKCPIWEHFGVSEAQMVLGHGPNVPKRFGTVGVAWGAKPAVLDENLAPQPQGVPGRLAFGLDYPGFFLEYLGDRAQTDATKRDGWFLTNDLATIDEDGYVSVLGRADDCFKSKGVLIVPREVEDALLQLGTIEEACVFNIPDSEIGNRIGAGIVLRSNAAAEGFDKHAIIDRLKGKIAPFKFPHDISIFAELPKNANGKTQRREVYRLWVERGDLV